MHAFTPPPSIDPALLLAAYRVGVFPMADTRDDPDIYWVEPRRRAILDRVTTELDAPSRNFVIITAYEAFLPPLD